MEGLIAALSGWITTEDFIINLQTGLRVANLTEDEEEPKAEIFSPMAPAKFSTEKMQTPFSIELKL